MTSPTLPAMNDTWTVRVPKLAIDYEPLLSAIMLIASHHLACIKTTPEEVEHHLTLRSLYLGSTLQAHRPASLSVTKENAEAVCFTALILSVDNMANLQNRPLEPYEPPLQWFQLCKSIEGVWRLAFDLVKDDVDSRIRPATETMLPWYREAKAFSPERLNHLIQAQEDESIDADDMKVYQETVGVLSWILAGIESGEDLNIFCRRLRLMPFLLSDRFINLLDKMDCRAMVLLAHYFAMTSYAGELWWIGESPLREVKAIERFLDEKWQVMLAWPLDMTQKQDVKNKRVVVQSLNSAGST
ncbi:hypothetical protein FSARC_9547 [Fusarium sarcochroum]|uniref:Uncharacterized protein n=1 Tax=Fusarium sarcochroum TaxID=1208366 RepID=A0A8H4TQU2_9HYPO|nr:hypothetical protein FSARC_9547 [Fusarium sarcochroum]